MRIQRCAVLAIIVSIGLWYAVIPPAQAAEPATLAAPGGLTLIKRLSPAPHGIGRNLPPCGPTLRPPRSS